MKQVPEHTFDKRIQQLESRGFQHTKVGIERSDIDFALLYHQVTDGNEAEWTVFIEDLDKRIRNLQSNKKCVAKDSLGNLSKGEYTGYSPITGMHHVSFYNGDTKGFKTITEITFE